MEAAASYLEITYSWLTRFQEAARIYTIPGNGPNNNIQCRGLLSSSLEYVLVYRIFDIKIYSSDGGPFMQLPQRYDQGMNR